MVSEAEERELSSGAEGMGTPPRCSSEHGHEHRGWFGAVQDTRHHTAPLSWDARGAGSACRHRAGGHSISPCPALGSCQLWSIGAKPQRGAVGARSQAAHPQLPAPLPGHFCLSGQPKPLGCFLIPAPLRTRHEGCRCRETISSPCSAPCTTSSSPGLLQGSSRACGSSSSLGEPSPAQLSIRPGVPMWVPCPRSHAGQWCRVLSPHCAARCRAGSMLA